MQRENEGEGRRVENIVGKEMGGGVAVLTRKWGSYLDIHDCSESLRSAWSAENPRCWTNKSRCV